MSVVNDPSSFKVMTSFEGRTAVLVLHGRVESLAAFDLWAALSGTLDLHQEEVVLDLSELDFMGADGLVALANAEQSFAEAGVELTVRAPSRLVQRILGAMDPTELARLDRALARLGHFGAQQVGESSRLISTQVSTEDLRQVSAVPTHYGAIDGAVRLVVQLAQASVSGADGVSVSLVRRDELQTVAATDGTIMEMDAEQYATGEGPCVDASVRGRWFHAESLDTETRWPSFTPRARALGIMAILSSPLTACEEPVGALNIYSRTASMFDEEAQRMAANFARKTSLILSAARTDVADMQIAVQFQKALRSRDIIATAEGIVAERENLNEDDAFTNLLRQSIKTGMSLLHRAEAFALSTAQPETQIER